MKFYFKEEPIRPGEIEAEQLKKIQEFKKDVSKFGGLYHTFTNTDEFSKLLRMHISFQVQEWEKRIRDNSTIIEKMREPQIDSNEKIEKKENEFEEARFLDLVELGTENFNKLTEVSRKIIDASSSFMKT